VKIEEEFVAANMGEKENQGEGLKKSDSKNSLGKPSVPRNAIWGGNE